MIDKMNKKEGMLYLVIIIMIALPFIMGGSCNRLMEWGAFYDREECWIDCHINNPIFADREDYKTEIGLMAFGTEDAGDKYCSGAKMFFFEDLHLTDPDNIINDVLGGGWEIYKGEDEFDENVYMNEIFKRLSHGDTAPYPQFQGIYTEASYEGEAVPDITSESVGFAYNFDADFPCEGKKTYINVYCKATSSIRAQVGCNPPGEGGSHSTGVTGVFKCDIFRGENEPFQETDCSNMESDLETYCNQYAPALTNPDFIPESLTTNCWPPAQN